MITCSTPSNETHGEEANFVNYSGFAMKKILLFVMVLAAVGLGVTPASAQPPIPIATAATSITVNGFTANWDASAGASGYFLDVE